MQHPAYGLPRIPLPRTPVNKGKKKSGPGSMARPTNTREDDQVSKPRSGGTACPKGAAGIAREHMHYGAICRI
jgi:hypothetical protein